MHCGRRERSWGPQEGLPSLVWTQHQRPPPGWSVEADPRASLQTAERQAVEPAGPICGQTPAAPGWEEEEPRQVRGAACALDYGFRFPEHLQATGFRGVKSAFVFPEAPPQIDAQLAFSLKWHSVLKGGKLK